MRSEIKVAFILFWTVFYAVACRLPKIPIAVDTQLKNHAVVQPYIRNPAYKIELHDTDILLQRKNLGKKYAAMYLLSATKETNSLDSLTLFEIDNQNNSQKIVFPRTPSPLTPLMNTYYSKETSRVYANTIPEMLNYLNTGYAQKTWLTALDTHLCPKKWIKKPLPQKIYLIKV